MNLLQVILRQGHLFGAWGGMNATYLMLGIANDGVNCGRMTCRRRFVPETPHELPNATA
jgi:hypothetical protein